MPIIQLPIKTAMNGQSWWSSVCFRQLASSFSINLSDKQSSSGFLPGIAEEHITCVTFWQGRRSWGPRSNGSSHSNRCCYLDIAIQTPIGCGTKYSFVDEIQGWNIKWISAFGSSKMLETGTFNKNHIGSVNCVDHILHLLLVIQGWISTKLWATADIR